MPMETSVSQTTSNVFMVRPANFGFNFETAASNSFQVNIDKKQSPEIVIENAKEEFDNLVNKLKQAKINVEVVEDSINPKNPDAVFPNNWISTHEPNVIVTYPMFAPQRRKERRVEIIEQLEQKYNIKERFRFENFESEERFLEGTGSMVFDRKNKIAYACRSIRTDDELFRKFCEKLDFYPILFNSYNEKSVPIYHTNVMMNVGEDFVIICFESIPSASEKRLLKNSFEQTGKKVIEISLNQLEQFAGNMIQLKNEMGEKYLVMSSSAYNSLDKVQLNKILPLTKIIHSDLTTIETYGGGSARCMIAELFLEKNTNGIDNNHV